MTLGVGGRWATADGLVALGGLDTFQGYIQGEFKELSVL